MFEFERRQRPRFVAAQAGEAHQRANVGPALQQQRLLARRVERLGAEADGGRDQASCMRHCIAAPEVRARRLAVLWRILDREPSGSLLKAFNSTNSSH